MTNTPSRRDRVEQHVTKRVLDLQARYRRNVASAVADLAQLRRGVGQEPGEDIALLGIVFGDDSDALHGGTRLPDEPTAEEHAAYTALTLYAVHQQSKHDASMHRSGYSFGRSARLLGRRSGSRDAVRARFTALGTATSWTETLQHARGLVQQFRQHSIPLDYGRFAADLFELRRPTTADRVRLKWGRDFYRISDPADEAEAAEPAITD